jgi:putative NADH-flavin reductase
MRVVVFGATGTVGREIVQQARERHLVVTGFVRDPRRLGSLSGRVNVVAGDALDANAVRRAVSGQDAVLYAVGAGSVRRTTLFSASASLLVEAMHETGVGRLVCLTGVGAGDTKGHGGFLYDRILYPLFTRGIYADKDRQEAIVRASSLDWTLVRAAPFARRTPAGRLQVATDVRGVTLRKISPPEVAGFMLDEVEQNRFVRQAVFIGHP